MSISITGEMPAVGSLSQAGWWTRRKKGRGIVSQERTLHPKLREIEMELAASTTRAALLVDRAGEVKFHMRPEAGRWSIADCIGHLTLTTLAYLPLIDDALQIGRLLAVKGPRRFRRDLTGWLLCQISEPPYRYKALTTERFTPEATGTRAEVLAAFVRSQQELNSRIYHAEGLDLSRLTLISPFDGRLQYNLYSGFRIIPTHQRRHLWQAEQIMEELERLTGHVTEPFRLAESAD
jgi:hypothetical protein